MGAALGLELGGALLGAHTPLATLVAGLLVPVGIGLGLTGKPRWKDNAPVRAPMPPVLVPPPAPEPFRDLLPMVQIPAGRFLMGSPRGEGHPAEKPQHPVRISAFSLGETPVTRAQWAEILGTDAPGRGPSDAPVNKVSWHDTLRFCNAASRRAGLDACYEETAPDQWIWHPAANGYRLPTEAEWEYACRAGTTTPWSCPEEALPEHAWFGEPGGAPHAVRGKRPNPWRLYDLHGNVWEWCFDLFDSSAYGKRKGEVVDPIVDKIVDKPSSTLRVVRGGSCGSTPGGLRSSDRNVWNQDVSGNDVGFRCARGPRRQPW